MLNCTSYCAVRNVHEVRQQKKQMCVGKSRLFYYIYIIFFVSLPGPINLSLYPTRYFDSIAWLVSPQVELQQPGCLKFDALRLNQSNFGLLIMMHDGTYEKTPRLSNSDGWFPTQMSLPRGIFRLQFAFYGASDPSSPTFSALDNIRVTTSPCRLGKHILGI